MDCYNFSRSFDSNNNDNNITRLCETDKIWYIGMPDKFKTAQFAPVNIELLGLESCFVTKVLIGT